VGERVPRSRTNQIALEDMGDAPRRSVFRRAAPAGGAAADTARAPAGAPPPVRAKGVRASVFSKNTLTSTGLAALDSALGGGVALGTVLCVIEDSPSECHALLLKHFLAQGLVHGHLTALCSAEDDLLSALPEPIQPGDGRAEGSETRPSSCAGGAGPRGGAKPSTHAGGEKPKEDHLKIAWRYKESLSAAERQAAAPSSSVAADYCLRFDLSRTRDGSKAAIAQGSAGTDTGASVRHVALTDWQPAASRPQGVQKAWPEIAALVDGLASRAAHPSPDGGGGERAEDKVCRIALSSLGGPMWWSRATQVQASVDAAKTGAMPSRSPCARREGLRDTLCFMHALKGKVRGSSCVVFATIPSDLAASAEGKRMLRIADYILRLDSMHSCPSAVREQYSEYAAFLHLQKVRGLAGLRQ